MKPFDDVRRESPALSRDQLLEMLRRMLRIRLFDQEATRIRSALIPGALHNSIGQEAEIVGACMALREDDYMTGNHRSHGHPIGKGVALARLMAELMGKATGVCGGKGGSMHLAAFQVGSLGESGIVGSLMPVAAGAALSCMLRKSGQVCLCFFGDGAANCGPFHESLNLASVWKLPVIFLCENNGYAICTAQAQTTAVSDIAVRAAAYNMPGEIVDGQKVLDVYQVVSSAVVRARRGGGPTLVEAKTYRYCDHQEDCEFPKYRSSDEVVSWLARDPILDFTGYLTQAREFSSRELEGVREGVASEVQEALEFAKKSPEPELEELQKDVFFQALEP